MCKLNEFNKYASFVLVLVCIACLLFGFVCYAFMVCKERPVVERVLVYTSELPDSTVTCKYITKEQADELIKSVRNYDVQLAERYQYLVEHKEQDSQLFYWGSLIVSIVVSIVGWFGYKSFNTLEDTAIETAKKNAMETAKINAQEYLEKNLSKEVANASNRYFTANASDILKEKIKSELEPIIQRKIENLNINDKLNNLEQQYSSIDTKIEEKVEDAIDRFFDNLRQSARESLKGLKNKEEEQK